jgi:TPR repeat protein
MRMVLRALPVLFCLLTSLPAQSAQSENRAAGAVAGQLLQQAADAYESKNYAKVVELLRPLAEKNEPYAAFVFGLLAARGEGQAKNLPLAESWWKKSAAAGNALAQFNLGYLYFTGVLGAQDLAGARANWTKAARQKQPDALYGLGVMNSNGLGGAADMKAAVKNYQEAAALGHPLAEYELGLAYLEGREVATDKKKAREFFEKAAGKGMPEARNALEALRNEEGSPKPERKKPAGLPLGSFLHYAR